MRSLVYSTHKILPFDMQHGIAAIKSKEKNFGSNFFYKTFFQKWNQYFLART